MNLRAYLSTSIALVCLFAQPVEAQMERRRAESGGPAAEAFWAPSVIGLQSVTQLPAGNANVTIMHVFGPASSGADDLFGLDGAANIRFGFDLGLTDRLSVGLGRSRFDKQYDGRFKLAAIRQTRDGRLPISLSISGSVAAMTIKNGYSFKDRLRYLISAPIARRFSDRFSLQMSPMWAHANTVVIETIAGERIEEENDHVALGITGRYVLTEGVALTAEVVPVLGNRSDGTENAFAFGLDLETGGHVFQVFFATSNGLTEERMVAASRSQDLRLGFNVNRVFGLRK